MLNDFVIIVHVYHVGDRRRRNVSAERGGKIVNGYVGGIYDGKLNVRLLSLDHVFFRVNVDPDPIPAIYFDLRFEHGLNRRVKGLQHARNVSR